MNSRILIVLALAIALFSAAFAPVAANAGAGTGGTDDLETVRAAVMEKYNLKISLLTEKMNATDNADATAVFAGGIAELVGLRDTRVATEDNVDELWALKERAGQIYNETIAAAGRAGMTDAEYLEYAKNKARNVVSIKVSLLTELGQSCNSDTTWDIVEDGIGGLKALLPRITAAETPDAAFALKEEAYSIFGFIHEKGEAACDGKDDLTEEELDAKELKEARYGTLALIERKAAILNAAAEASDNMVIKEIYADAAEEVAALEGAARSAKTVAALREIREKVVAIYHGARDSIANLNEDHDHSDDKSDDEKSDDHEDNDASTKLEEHLGKVGRYVDYLVEIASASDEASPETFAALEDAHEGVHEAIAAVLDVTESGKRLEQKWQDLEYAMKMFKHAFIAHYVALSEGPFALGGVHIPG